MLRQLHIQNFRSVRKASVAFSESGLTVVVGANGSGKSNLIKSLEFLSTIARDGLERALTARRGIEGIVPKSLASQRIEGAQLELAYDLELPRLQHYPADFPPLLVHHRLQVEYHTSSFPSLVSEELVFSNPLLVQFFLPPSGDSERLNLPHALSDVPLELRTSELRINRGASGELTITGTPGVTANNVEAYLRWFNLTALADHFRGKSAANLFALLSTVFSDAAPQMRPVLGTADAGTAAARVTSILERAGASPLLVAPEIEAVRSAFANIRRYDLQLIELRKEQIPNPRSDLTREGRGMPSAVRKLKDESADSGAAWQRITETLSVIAPHVMRAQVSSLTSEKEFLEFIESKLGRPVESWEASDGTLRALAILVALERHPANGIILIEEPEQGLHPWAIAPVIDHMRRAIVARGLQVVLTTHSSQVLENIKPGELLIATRSSDQGTRFVGIDKILPSDHMVEMGDVGQLWVAGLLGGVPAPADSANE